MPFYLFWPDADDLVGNGFGKVADVPCIFDGNWAYHEEGSSYLAERALRTYIPVNGRFSLGSLTEHSKQAFGECICNFFEYCELRKLSWKHVTYDDHILDGYQKEMRSGTFSTSKKGLQPSTVNGRVDEACHFLDWAFQRGLRGPFFVPMTEKLVSAPQINSSHGHKKKKVYVRTGAVRPKPVSLRMPEKEEVATWLDSVEKEKGYTKRLMCELIIDTAIRREEAVQWRVDTLPSDRKDWNRTGNLVTLMIKYGTKGAKYVNEYGELEGPERPIVLSIEMAEKIHAYLNSVQPKIFANYVRKGRTKEEKAQRTKSKTDKLFLSEFTGQPISAQILYEAWTEVSRQPYKGWSPHIGRHYWACNTLLMEIEKRMKALKKLKKHEFPADWIQGTAKDILLFLIQPQLGHLSPEITLAYTTWVQKQFAFTDTSDKFEDALDAE